MMILLWTGSNNDILFCAIVAYKDSLEIPGFELRAKFLWDVHKVGAPKDAHMAQIGVVIMERLVRFLGDERLCTAIMENIGGGSDALDP